MLGYRIICLVMGYIFGLFPSGKIVGRIKHVDLSKEGSGNTGATNALRVTGVGGGVLTLLGDVLKAVIPVVLAYAFFHKQGNGIQTLMLYAGIGAFLGHCFPVTGGFAGGKGIACFLGVGLAVCARMVIVPLILFILLAVATGYVSLASIAAVTAVAAESYVFAAAGLFRDTGAYRIELCILFTILAAVAIYKHKDNIKRLRAGTENRFGHKKKA